MKRAIVCVSRRSLTGQRSQERVWADVLAELDPALPLITLRPPFQSRGVVRRVLNVLWAVRLRGGLVHITGDIHYLALVLSRRRLILTIHDMSTLHTRRSALAMKIMEYFWFTMPMKRATVVTTISRAMAEEILDRYPLVAHKLVVIPNPLSSAFLHRADATSKAERPVRPRSPATDEQVRVLMVGTKPNKNLERVVQAVTRAGFHLVVVGRLSATQEAVLANSLAAYESHVDLEDAELVALYRTAHVLAFPSLYEGFGLPIIEAQAMCLPVVTSDIPVLREVAGEGAIFVDPLDSYAIQAGLELAIGDSTVAADMINRGCRNVKRFSAPAIAKQYEDLYRRWS